MHPKITRKDAAMLYLTGEPVAAIAARYSCGVETVLRWLHGESITIHPRGQFRKGRTPTNKRQDIRDAVTTRYASVGADVLAKEFDTTKASVHQIASRLGVQFAGSRALPTKQKEAISMALKGRSKDEAWRAKLSTSLQGRKHSPERLAAIADGLSKSRSTRRGMTKPERTVNLLLRFMFGAGNPYTYTGNRTKWIRMPDGKQKNPDFTCEPGRKVIEVFGDYWHRGEDPDRLVRMYAAVGWECLVIWESEVMIRDAILQFTYPEEYVAEEQEALKIPFWEFVL